MKIAYLTGEYPRATDTFIQREIKALRQKGLEVFSFSVRRPSKEHLVGTEQQVEREQTFYILPPNLLNLLLAHVSLFLISPLRYLRALKIAWNTKQDGIKGTIYQLFYFLEAGILARQIHKQQIQHLHNHIASSSCTVAMLAAELGGFSYSFTLHGPHIFFEPHRWRLDEKIKRALFVVCISHFCRSQAMIFAPPEAWSKMHIIHCGVDPTLFNPIAHQSSSHRLLYVGRLAPEKGLPILLKSLVKLKRTIPNLKLTVVGDGRYRHELEKMTSNLELQDHVEFVGYKSQPEVREYLQNTDVFVLPSFAEGVPVVLMEAMAVGIPIVTTQIAGVAELVEHGVSGYLVPPGDEVSLAVHLQSLLNKSELRTKFGAAGRKKVEKEFNLCQETASLYNLFKANLASKNSKQ